MIWSAVTGAVVLLGARPSWPIAPHSPKKLSREGKQIRIFEALDFPVHDINQDESKKFIERKPVATVTTSLVSSTIFSDNNVDNALWNAPVINI